MSLSVDIEKKLGSFRLQVKFETGSHVLGLLGASGCGKSLTLKCIAGIEKPDRGKILLNGKILFDSEKHINLPPQKRRVGYLFQQCALFPNMTVEQNIACGVRDVRDRTDRRAIATKMIERMHLNGLEKKKPEQLSGGQQQRTALARILVNEPEVLLLDEPFSALDSHLRFRLEQELRNVIHKFGKTVLFVSHDRDEIFRLSSEIAIMKDGRLETVGTRHQVFEAPLTVSGAALTGCKNISPVRYVDPAHVYAENWGLTLRIQEGRSPDRAGGRTASCGDPVCGDSACGDSACKDPGYGKISHIGIRMHDVVPCPPEEENAVLCQVEEEIENPFSITVMLRPVQNKQAELIGMELPKPDWAQIRAPRLRIALPADRILLLTDSS